MRRICTRKKTASVHGKDSPQPFWYLDPNSLYAHVHGSGWVGGWVAIILERCQRKHIESCTPFSLCPNFAFLPGFFFFFKPCFGYSNQTGAPSLCSLVMRSGGRSNSIKNSPLHFAQRKQHDKLECGFRPPAPSLSQLALDESLQRCCGSEKRGGCISVSDSAGFGTRDCLNCWAEALPKSFCNVPWKEVGIFS